MPWNLMKCNWNEMKCNWNVMKCHTISWNGLRTGFWIGFDPQPMTRRTRFGGHACFKISESFKFFNGIFLKIELFSTILVVSWMIWLALWIIGSLLNIVIGLFEHCWRVWVAPKRLAFTSENKPSIWSIQKLSFLNEVHPNLESVWENDYQHYGKLTSR